MNEYGPIAVKDRILNAINGAENIDGILHVCAWVMPIIDNSAEFWQALGYSYKAAEIADRLIQRINELTEDAHHKTLAKCRDIKSHLHGVACVHRRLQMEYFSQKGA